MANLPEIKAHIQATQGTRKITQAMQLVAANKMKFFQHRAVNAREYAWTLLDILSYSEESWKNQGYAEEREEGATLFVLITSDKGLCGALNTRVINTLFRSKEWKETAAEERKLITIGRKSHEMAERSGIPVAKHFSGLEEEMTLFTALEVINAIVHYWSSGECKKIYLVSTHYVNPFVAHPQIKQYLPFSKEMVQHHFHWRAGGAALNGETTPSRLIIYEPGKERALETLSLQIIHMLFVQAFFEFKASEYSSRMVAMKKATEAADELISELTLVYNKTRQSIITQQLAELAAGSEAVEVEGEDVLETVTY